MEAPLMLLCPLGHGAGSGSSREAVQNLVDAAEIAGAVLSIFE